MNVRTILGAGTRRASFIVALAIMCIVPHRNLHADPHPQTCEDYPGPFTEAVAVPPGTPDGTYLGQPKTRTVCSTARLLGYTNRAYTIIEEFDGAQLVANAPGFPSGTFLVSTGAEGVWMSIQDPGGDAYASGNTLRWPGVVDRLGGVSRQFVYQLVVFNGPPSLTPERAAFGASFRIDLEGEPPGISIGRLTWLLTAHSTSSCLPGVVQTSMSVTMTSAETDDFVAPGVHVRSKKFGPLIECPLPGTAAKFTSHQWVPGEPGMLTSAAGSDAGNVRFMVVDGFDQPIDFSGDTAYAIDTSELMTAIPLSASYVATSLPVTPGVISSIFTLTLVYP